MQKVDNSGGGVLGPKNITKLPDHEKKAKLTDLTMGDKDDIEMNNVVAHQSNRSVKVKGGFR